MLFVSRALWIALIGFAGMAGAQQDATPGPVDLFLPDTVYAIPGVEMNVYFDNVILALNPANYAFDVTCDKGRQLEDRWTYTPDAGDAGSYPLTIDVRDQDNALIAHATTVVTVVTPQADRATSALLIGDSLTHAGVYSQRILDLGAIAGHPAISLIGSHGGTDDAHKNVHEGYGGWTAERFATHFTGIARQGDYKERGSPFLYETDTGEKQLDFKRYCADVHDGVAPDVITIFLGCNDTFSANDDTIDARIESMFGFLDQLIAMIRRDAPECRIGLVPPVPPAASQDAFGANYNNGQTRWQYKRNQHRVVQAMYARYGIEGDGSVTVVPAFVNLDCKRNYPATDGVQVNGVHPAASGYNQIGDSIFCWMMAR